MMLFKNRSFWIILFILGFFISLGSVSAEHTTAIKAVYFYNVALDVYDLNDNVAFVHGRNPTIQTWLSVDGGEPQWYRYISLGIYDRYGKKCIMTKNVHGTLDTQCFILTSLPGQTDFIRCNSLTKATQTINTHPQSKKHNYT